MVYTAATRSTTTTILISDPRTLQAALARDDMAERRTFLTTL
jgi:ATP-dependent exoDNAse (exonuclease V) alpha subunit